MIHCGDRGPLYCCFRMTPSELISDRTSREETPPQPHWWVGITGLCCLLLIIILIPLVMITSPRVEAPRSGADLLYWTLLGGFWLSPLLLAYAFVLTAVRSDPADWRRGRRWFLITLAYLAALAVLGLSVAGM